MKKLFLLVSLISAINISYSQNKDLANSIGVIGGFAQYNGDLGQGFYQGTTNAFGGLSFSHYINGHFDFVFNATVGRWGYEATDKTKFDAKMMQGNAHFRIKLINSDLHKFSPFIFAGIGVADYSDYTLKNSAGIQVDNPQGNGTDLFVPYGGGFQYQVSEKFNLSLQELFGYTDHDRRDGEERQNNESFLFHTIGISYNFGKVSDTDKDGVNDHFDKCPNTPKGIAVDKKGCPLDRDGDGVADFLDSCPDVKGLITAHGCPDKDGDGVADKDDQCPNDPGPVETKGCPDRDKDGVMDADDKCPDVPGSMAAQGCPDRDEDGILDASDACPDQKGTETMHGCPDSDGDGIPDNVDKCPNEKGIAANNGCPDVNAEANLENLYYGSDQYLLNSVHVAILKKAVQLLNDNPLYNLNIDGHTDNHGKDDANMRVSQLRANTVMNYLQKIGIAAERMKATGYGKTKPIESNDTEAGKAKNRRVELKVILP